MSDTIEFGVFDHVDFSATTISQNFSDRLSLVEEYDRNGFYCYHAAEHHFTRLSIAPSPGLYLSAVAQRTSRILFGPLVYLLPLYHPLRLIEEICMLDHMSGGRFQIGFGPGISPIEVGFFGRHPETLKQVFEEVREIVLLGLTRERLSFRGQHFDIDDVPMVMSTLQKPTPPVWAGVGSIASTEAAAARNINVCMSLRGDEMRSRRDAYWAVWNERHGATAKVRPRVGITELVVVADTDEEARAIAEEAYAYWHDSFHYLYSLHGRGPVKGERAPDFAELIERKRGIAGSPETVAEYLIEQVGLAGANYLVSQFCFGSISLENARRSVRLFAAKVIPAVRGAGNLD